MESWRLPASLQRLEQRSDVLSRAQLQAIALGVLVLHLLCFFGLANLMRPPASAAQGDSMAVVWLPATSRVSLPVPAMPVPPQRAVPVRVVRSEPAVVPAQGSLSSNSDADKPDPLARSTWLMPDGSLRRDRGRAELPTWTDQDRISLSRVTRLPGSTDAASAEKVAIRLRRAMTPEDVVNAVLRFLFGQVTKDDCRAIEGRLHLSDPGVSREIDLAKYRKTCTP